MSQTPGFLFEGEKGRLPPVGRGDGAHLGQVQGAKLLTVLGRAGDEGGVFRPRQLLKPPVQNRQSQLFDRVAAAAGH